MLQHPAARSLLLLLARLLAGPRSAAPQEGSERRLHWRELAIEARLDDEGRLHVRERQAMVFDGAWNGGEREFDVRLGQRLALHGVARIDPATGARTPLREGDLGEVDEYERDGQAVRWRSRLPSDPPFRNQEIVYELDYTFGPVVTEAESGGYVLRHDFAFADRAGVIEHFRVRLTLDSTWASPTGRVVEETAEGLPAGRGYVLSVPLRYTAAGRPAALATGAPLWARSLVAVGALLVPLFVFVGLRRRDRALDRVAPLTPPEAIDAAWLGSHLFVYPAEVVGTSWDRSVGEAEVAALLARLVAEGKLTSRVEADGDEPVLHLRRVTPLADFAPHERALLEALFFDGAEETDTAAVREHYQKKGFDPAGLIRPALMKQLDTLPGHGRVARSWMPAAGVMIAGVVLSLGEAVRPGGAVIAAIGVLIAAIVAAVALASAADFAKRVTHRGGARAGVLLPLTLAAALLALLAAGAFEGDAGLLFYRPGTRLLLGQLVLLAGLGLLATAVARPTQTPERLAFRRRLASARAYFRAELTRPEPRLQDEWFPYLLAFGLGPHIDRWFRDFGGTRTTGGTVPVIVATGAGTRGGTPSGGWSGGGPHFGGGGGFGGGGAGGSWSVAAAGIASGVAAPSSGGGGGAAVSGGGGGGGW